MTRQRLLYAAIGTFLLVLAASWLTHGRGIVRNDLARNVYIPDELTMPLQVKAAYNGRDIFFRYRWPAAKPSIYHDMLRYESGEWVRYGASTAGPQPQGLYEDRVTMLVDDGSVPEFARYGGYITAGDRMRFFTGEATEEEVRAHPYLGGKRGQTEVGKHLPATRRDPADWASVVSEEELAALREAGYFLDLWHWRAHRSNPIGASDDQYVFDARFGDTGQGPFSTNWDAERRQPLFMFDEDRTGFAALRWDDLIARRLGFDDRYFLSEDVAAPFDASHAWQEGDTIPRRLLRSGAGSRADIKVAGIARWRDGYWDVTLRRAMDTGRPRDDKIFRDMGSYTVAFAVHRGALGSRWHLVSMPVSLGLERDAEFKALRFDGDTPAWDQDWFGVTLFYPGQVSWPHVNSGRHAGAKDIKKAVPVKVRHSEIQLAHYAVEAEFASEIVRQWLLTLLAGLALIAAFAAAVINLLPAKGSARKGD